MPAIALLLLLAAPDAAHQADAARTRALNRAAARRNPVGGDTYGAALDRYGTDRAAQREAVRAANAAEAHYQAEYADYQAAMARWRAEVGR